MSFKLLAPFSALVFVFVARDFWTATDIEWLLLFFLSMTISAGLMPLVIRFAFRFNLLDQPDQRKIHLNPTPKIGGLAVAAGFLPALLIAEGQSPELTAIIAGTLLIFFSGIMDDIFCLSAKLRFLVQLSATLLVIWLGVRLSIFSETMFLGLWLNVALTIIWIIGITNAFNFLDGINGEASGLALIIGVTLAIFAFAHSASLRGEVIMIATGAVAGFIPYNLKRRAEIFLGDGGSGFIGFFLAVMSLYIEWGEKPGLVNLLMPMSIFSLCIYDMSMTTITRIYTGKIKSISDWLIYTGKDHIHHRLSDIFSGSRLAAVFFIYAIATANCVFPVLYTIYRGSSEWFVYASFAQMLLIYAMITIMLFRCRYR